MTGFSPNLTCDPGSVKMDTGQHNEFHQSRHDESNTAVIIATFYSINPLPHSPRFPKRKACEILWEKEKMLAVTNVFYITRDNFFHLSMVGLIVS